MGVPVTVAARAGRAVNRALRPLNVELRRRPAGSEAPVLGPPVLETPVVEPMPVQTSVATPAPDRWSTDQLAAPEQLQSAYAAAAAPIIERHRAQSAADVRALKARYAEPIFGRVRVWDLIERLGCCIDPTDQRLYAASQQAHVLQMISQMESDGAATPDLVLVALIHDLGKLLLLTDEDPANVVCMNAPVGEWEPGSGLDNCLLQWNHDEFAYERFKDLIPDELAWLIRYHSLERAEADALLDEQDRQRAARLLTPFAHYDHATKTPFALPAVSLLRYRDLVEEAFPEPIPF